MMTLIVSYLPRGERSHTRRVLEAFRAELPDGQVEELDLLVDVPDLLLREQVDAYIQRNYLKSKLSSRQSGVLAKMDRMTAQLKAADPVVMAFPMYNFSLPAVVKAWFDSVMQKGETWTADASGYRGLMQGRRALVIMASGGEYDGDRVPMEHAVELARTAFGFMGFSEFRAVTAAGVNQHPDRADHIVASACAKARAIAREWARAGRSCAPAPHPDLTAAS